MTKTADHLLVFFKTPYVDVPIGVRVKEGLIIDSDPRASYTQGWSLLRFREWLKRRPERGWYIVREQELNDSPPLQMVAPREDD